MISPKPLKRFNPSKVRLEPIRSGQGVVSLVCFNPSKVRLEQLPVLLGSDILHASTPRRCVWNAFEMIENAATLALQPLEGASGTQYRP